MGLLDLLTDTLEVDFCCSKCLDRERSCPTCNVGGDNQNVRRVRQQCRVQPQLFRTAVLIAFQ